MHLAQASVYAMLGLERMQDLYKSGTGYAFNADFVDDLGPTLPDIFTDFTT